MGAKRRICVVTGTRAEYGLLRPLLAEIKRRARMELCLVATGTHLSAEHGLTCREIINDGYVIDRRVRLSLDNNTASGIAKSISEGIEGCVRAYRDLSPNLVVLLGDRFEAFAAATAALLMLKPVAHLHGGEITAGAIDESFRHAITKMSHLHFTSSEEYRQRVIQMGEIPTSVFQVGALGLDNIRQLKLLRKQTLQKELNFKFGARNLLITYHPVTIEPDSGLHDLSVLLEVLDQLKDTHLIFTKANADAGGRKINKIIDRFVALNRDTRACYCSLGQLKYLSTMQFVDAVVGNSSSGIIEAPSFEIGTINIGDRQKGRMRAGSIIDCPASSMCIFEALKKLYSSRFQEMLSKVENPYGDGRSACRIAGLLEKVDLREIVKKRFCDIEFEVAGGVR